MDIAAYGLKANGYRVRDVWSGQDIGMVKAVDGLSLAPHACVLWVLRQ
jgi:hypothetical protein